MGTIVGDTKVSSLSRPPDGTGPFCRTLSEVTSRPAPVVGEGLDRFRLWSSGTRLEDPRSPTRTPLLLYQDYRGSFRL